MWYLIVLALLLSLLAYLLWMPLELRVDSSRKLFCLRAGVLAQASLEPEPDQLLRVHLRAGPWHFYWRPADFKVGRAKKPAGKHKSGPNLSARQAARLARSFRVRHFRWDLDTGNPVLNARLYPAFYLLDRTLGGFGVNFQDCNRLTLRVVNRPARILLALMKH